MRLALEPAREEPVSPNNSISSIYNAMRGCGIGGAKVHANQAHTIACGNKLKMSSSICEPPDEPAPCASVEDDLSSLQRRFSTEHYYIDKCDVGVGVFANRDIAPGEVILALEGPRIDFAETKRRGQ